MGGTTSGQEFVVRLVSIDYYMAQPIPGLDSCYSELEGVVIDKVPVIRIFGPTPGGQKACVHVHGVRLKSPQHMTSKNSNFKF
jgi:hypothetical protein